MGQERAGLTFDSKAVAELKAAAQWYDEKLAGTGKGFLEAVEEALFLIREFPEIGSPVPGVPPQLRARRVGVAGFPYSVVYFSVQDGIRVVAFAHARRRPGYWRSRR